MITTRDLIERLQIYQHNPHVVMLTHEAVPSECGFYGFEVIDIGTDSESRTTLIELRPVIIEGDSEIEH